MAPTAQAGPREAGTRDRIVTAAAEGFARRGYAGTGLKAILTASHAPFGSLYHFFPGGKEELGAAAIRTSGVTYRELVERFFPPGADVVAATAEFFVAGAEMLVATDYADACPIATITLETASESEAMRVASAEVFESWLAVLEARLVDAGIDAATARELAVELFCAVEGAFLHCRATRTIEALEVVGRASTARVAGALPSAP
jgi:TetR/AcrR family transcriptional regulator, lmrAB and yxaGH operons repressor